MSLVDWFNSLRSIDVVRQLLRFTIDTLSQSPYFRIVPI